MSETKNSMPEKRTQEHLIDISYKDEIGAAEILQLESLHMFSTDGSVDLNVCSVSENGSPSLCLKLNEYNMELILY
jgi:hypothetical protein